LRSDRQTRGQQERFPNSRGLFDAAEGGIFFHPSDEDLSPGTPAGKCHSTGTVSVYTNSGTAVTSIPGISALTAHTLLAEIGPDLSRFPNVAAFASWLALCPANKKSGGKVLSAKTRQSHSRASRALRIAAQTLARSRSHLGNFYRRMRARLGPPQAITATAHKLARIVYHLITTGQAYDESVFLLEDQKLAQRHEKRLRKQARNLGFQLVPIAA